MIDGPASTPAQGLDAVIIGYNDGDFDDYRLLSERAGQLSPEMQIFRKEHLLVGGRPLPWLDAFNRIRAARTGQFDRYHPGELFNLAAIYLTSFLRRRGFTAEPISLFAEELGDLRGLLDEHPRVVAITTTFYVNVIPVVPVVEFIRENSPESMVVVGGPLVDNLCREGIDHGVINDGLADMLTVMGADAYIWESQGETTLMRLCEAVRAGGSRVDRVPNLVLRSNGAWRATGREAEANDLDECSVDWLLFSREQVGVTAQVRTARSCAFKCSFCDYPARGGALTTASVETVRAELHALVTLGVQNVVFIDDTFNVPPKRFKEMCRMMIDEDLGLSWYSYFRCANAKDEETFDLAAESGCAGVFLGVESADNTVLGNMRKLTQDVQYRDGIRLLKERGITTFAALISGFPGETSSSVQTTIDFVNETGPDFWRVQPWWANPRSPIYARATEFQIQGARYSWSHYTMTSDEAALQADRMFESVTSSTWLPLYNFDFWSLPYLAGKGVAAGELKQLLQASYEIMRHRDRGDDTVAAQLRFDELVERSSPAPAKYHGREAALRQV